MTFDYEGNPITIQKLKEDNMQPIVFPPRIKMKQPQTMLNKIEVALERLKEKEQLKKIKAMGEDPPSGGESEDERRAKKALLEKQQKPQTPVD